MNEDKRRHERHVMTQKLELTDHNNRKYAAQGINISESGLRCVCDKPIDPGTHLTIPLSIPAGNSSRNFTCEGTVLKCTEENGKFIIIIDFTDGSDVDDANCS